MKFTIPILVFLVFIVSICDAADPLLPPSDSTTDLPIAVDKKKTTTTTARTTTTEGNSTTLAPTSAPTSTSTVNPTTKTTTTTTTTTTTPTPPTTTSAPIPTTTSKPTPLEMGTWSITESNHTCIVVQFATQFKFNYTDSSNTTKTVVYNLPDKDAKTTNGSCGSYKNGSQPIEQWIEITWNDRNESHSLNIKFNLNQTSHEFSLTELVVSLGSNVFPNPKNQTVVLYHGGKTFATLNQRSYHCTRAQDLALTDSLESNKTMAVVSFSQTQIEAFRMANTKDFSAAIDCDAISTPDIVPIAVGIALIALVVIVLIAYLVGRRRTRNQGYVSM